MVVVQLLKIFGIADLLDSNMPDEVQLADYELPFEIMMENREDEQTSMNGTDYLQPSSGRLCTQYSERLQQQQLLGVGGLPPPGCATWHTAAHHQACSCQAMVLECNSTIGFRCHLCLMAFQCSAGGCPIVQQLLLENGGLLEMQCQDQFPKELTFVTQTTSLQTVRNKTVKKPQAAGILCHGFVQ